MNGFLEQNSHNSNFPKNRRFKQYCFHSGIRPSFSGSLLKSSKFAQLMKKILVIGAGRSSSNLIKYLLTNSEQFNWLVTVADTTEQAALLKTKAHERSRAIALDVNDASARLTEIGNCDLVISMLPAFMHVEVAKDCLRLKKHLVTASYVSADMSAMHEDASRAGLIFLNEIGLDPGIDHASAMKVIDEVHAKGGKFISFKSYCGGLIAPESDNNPWGYKFTWNPRNVVLAGQGTAQYISDGHYRFIPYNRLFTEIENIEIEGTGNFEGYANRDSLGYLNAYKLEYIPTMLRGTLRKTGYCKAYNAFVKLGLTDDSFRIAHSSEMTWRQLLESYLPKGHADLKLKLAEFLEEREDSEIMEKLEWLGILDDRPIYVKNGSPAMILQELLEEKWKLEKDDRDMIVMQHQFEFQYPDQLVSIKLTSSLVVKGDDQVYTAMSKTVGIPAAIGAKLILQNRITERGVLIPTSKEIYQPLLEELEEYDIRFVEKLRD